MTDATREQIVKRVYHTGLRATFDAGPKRGSSRCNCDRPQTCQISGLARKGAWRSLGRISATTEAR
jgi:hypothetical protein